MVVHHDLIKAITKALSVAGRGVLVTGITLIACVGLWSFSSLRFQAEMGILIALWFGISVMTALFVTPSLVYVLRPAFIVGKGNRGKGD